MLLYFKTQSLIANFPKIQFIRLFAYCYVRKHQIPKQQQNLCQLVMWLKVKSKIIKSNTESILGLLYKQLVITSSNFNKKFSCNAFRQVQRWKWATWPKSIVHRFWKQLETRKNPSMWMKTTVCAFWDCAVSHGKTLVSWFEREND